MEVDYDVYADGEALLGWLNATRAAGCAREFDGNAFLVELGTRLAIASPGGGSRSPTSR